MAGVAKVGPIRSQADSITAMMQSPQTVVHVVTLLEEMPVQETVDAIGELRTAGFGIGGVVVNQVREPAAAGAPRSQPRPAPGSTQARSPPTSRPSACGPATRWSSAACSTEAARPRRAGRAWSRRRSRPCSRLGRPTYRLPHLPDGIDAGAIRELADLLADQGMA